MTAALRLLGPCLGALAACIAVPPPLALPDGETTLPEADSGDADSGDADSADSGDADSADSGDADSDDGADAPDSSRTLVELACGERHCCARAADGRVACWGDRSRAQLGDALADGAGSARLVPGTFSALALGARHACALERDSGAVLCWGDNAGQQSTYDMGTLAVAPPRPYDFSRASIGATVLASLAPGRGRTQCGVVAAPAERAGDLVCWGLRLGLAGTPLDANPGLLERGLAETTYVASVGGAAAAACLGESHACVLVAGMGWVACWGHGADGQLGDGDTAGREAPTALGGLADLHVTALACGLRHTCVLGRARDDEPGEGADAEARTVVRCFGDNASGQVGAEPPDDRSSPHDVAVPEPVTQLAAGRAHTCALAAAGALYCWGDDTFAQLGPDAAGARWLPAAVSAAAFAELASSPRLLALGHDVTCVSDGARVVCWGSDAWGQLGSGTYGPPAVPDATPIGLPF